MDATLVTHYQCGNVIRRDLEFESGYREKFFKEIFKRRFNTGYGLVLHLEDKIVVTNVTIDERVLNQNGIIITKHKMVKK